MRHAYTHHRPASHRPAHDQAPPPPPPSPPPRAGTHLVQLLRGMHSQGQLASADRAWLASLLAALGSLPAAPTVQHAHAAAGLVLDAAGRAALAELRQLPVLPLAGGDRAAASTQDGRHITSPLPARVARAARQRRPLWRRWMSRPWESR